MYTSFSLLYIHSSQCCCCCCFYFAFTSHHTANVGTTPDKSIDWAQKAETLRWRLWMLWHSRMDTNPSKEHTHTVTVTHFHVIFFFILKGSTSLWEYGWFLLTLLLRVAANCRMWFKCVCSDLWSLQLVKPYLTLLSVRLYGDAFAKLNRNISGDFFSTMSCVSYVRILVLFLMQKKYKGFSYFDILMSTFDFV